VNFIQREAAHAFVDGMRGRDVNHLLIGGDRSFNGDLNQALNRKAAKAAAGPTVMMREVTRAPT
jgi:hypothetical protein